MNKFDKILYTIFIVFFVIEFLKFSLILALIALILLWLRTLMMTKEPNNQDFLQGSLPKEKPSGFYLGNNGFKTLWIGKKFDADSNTGTNIFKDKKDKQIEKYAFTTSVGTGLFDERLFVIKIDYNVKGNPFWVRWILDEIVQIAPDHYLGKMHLRIIPAFPFSILFFELKK